MADLNKEKRPSIKLILRDFRRRLFHGSNNPFLGWRGKCNRVPTMEKTAIREAVA